MSDASNPIRTGECRCGRVKLQISAPPMLTLACHCEGCQRMSASAFSLSAMMPAAGFAVTQGEPVIGGLHGSDAHHYFCPHCMSWMFNRVEGMDALVLLRATMLDDQTGLEPFIETWTSEKLPWATTPAVHSFERFPPSDAFGALMEEYATQAAPPRA